MKVTKVLMKEEVSHVFDHCLKRVKKGEFAPNKLFWQMWDHKRSAMEASGFKLFQNQKGESMVSWRARPKKSQAFKAAYGGGWWVGDEVSGQNCVPRKFRKKWKSKR